MRKLLPFMLIAIMCYGCQKSNGSLTLGKKLDNSLNVSEITDTFMQGDTFAYSVDYKKKFGSAKIVLKIFKIDNGKETEKYVNGMKADPEWTKFANELPVKKLMQILGAGEFRFVCFIDDKEYAGKKFTMK